MQRTEDVICLISNALSFYFLTSCLKNCCNLKCNKFSGKRGKYQDMRWWTGMGSRLKTIFSLLKEDQGEIFEISLEHVKFASLLDLRLITKAICNTILQQQAYRFNKLEPFYKRIKCSPFWSVTHFHFLWKLHCVMFIPALNRRKATAVTHAPKIYFVCRFKWIKYIMQFILIFSLMSHYILIIRDDCLSRKFMTAILHPTHTCSAHFIYFRRFWKYLHWYIFTCKHKYENES